MFLGPESSDIASWTLDPNENTQCVFRGPIKQGRFLARRGARLRGGAIGGQSDRAGKWVK